MNATTFLSASLMAERAGVPVAWLRREAQAGRIPYLSIGKRILFNPEVVERALVARVSERRELAHNPPPVRAELLTPDDAARILGVESQTLALWRLTGRHGLPFVRFGREIRYRGADLDAWIAARTGTSDRSGRAAHDPA